MSRLCSFVVHMRRSLAATFANMRYGGVEHARKALSKDVVVMKAIDAVGGHKTLQLVQIIHTWVQGAPSTDAERAG